MFNVLLALRRAPAQLGHAALATSNLRRPPSPTIYPDARRSAATLTGHVEPAPAASVLEPEPAEPLPHSDLQEFITILSTADSLSPAAVSRSAARVIRSSVKNGNVAEAVIILSALRAANDRRTVSGNAARFPLRLPSTTLVHGLLQQNNIHQAARFARDVMPVQEHLFRVKTIDVVIKALCPAPAPGEVGGRSASERMTMWKRSLWTREGWKLKPLPLRGSPESLAPLAWPTSAPVAYPSPPFAAPGQTASPHLDVNHPLRVQADPQERGQGLTASTRMAIALLAQARRTKQRRTNDMYKRVVDVCLFQGEIVTATLLFAILLYDLRKSQMRQQPSETLENTESVLDTPHRSLHFHRPRRPGCQDHPNIPPNAARSDLG
ncbi:hypothetical protein CALCODRAFT_278000 [Calocera cornea HHB12733]|uniref:Uncharacterized protein n=1 Tax=Calocera cornea HHB12733 TaxID=1353952 RepID=A0A165JQ28_9BASI|nr:hypothetical protein CALCODRAFT_278000 [Calocera cornea HHB12733]